MAPRSISPVNAFLMVVLITFWGSSFVVVKIILGEGLTPISIATFRFLVAGALFAVVLTARKATNHNYHLRVGRRDAAMLLFLALTGVTFFFTAQYTGIQMSDASIAAILVCLLSPILIATVSAKLLKERLMRKQFWGIEIAAAGTFIVVVGGSLVLQQNATFLIGSLILLSTPLMWTAYSLSGRKLMEKYDPFLLVAYISILGGLCLLPFSLAENSLQLISGLGLQQWLAILYLSSTCSLLGYYIWFYVLHKAGATVASSFLFAEPLVTALFASTFADEPFNPIIVIGAALIFIGVYLVTRNKSNNTRSVTEELQNFSRAED
jgi:drug/metabolite transporter (DMT)-like permease